MRTNKRFFIIVSIVALLLLVPLIAMYVTSEVNWTLSDFAIATVLLLGTGLGIDYVLRKVKGNKLKITVVVAILAILLLILAELAVGVFGTPLSGQ